LPFAIEEYEGTIFILICVASSPVVDDGNDPVGHGEGCDCAWFFDGAGISIKNFVSALVIAGWAKEDSQECAKLHGICNRGVVIGFHIGAKGDNAVFGKIKIATEEDFMGEVLF
jgi:hypothetical protein